MATAPVETIDFDQVFGEIAERLRKETERRLVPPLVRLWDGDWNLRGVVKKEIRASFQVRLNETGTGTLDLPDDYYLSKWLKEVHKRDTTSVMVTVDKDGARWGGRLEELKVIKEEDGTKYVRCLFKHDYEELKYILGFANPFLPPEVQFPKVWLLWGDAIWACKTTLFCNLLRLEGSLWMLSANPLDPSTWDSDPENKLDPSTWSIVVKPDLAEHRTVSALVYSRFKTIHDATKNVVKDAQLTWELRRWLEGDEPPWPGATVKHGALVVDLVDHSGWTTGTAFTGDVFTGLRYERTNIAQDGLTEDIETVPDPNMPVEYFQPGFLGTTPAVPGVVLHETEHGGIKTSEWSWKPATAVRVVGGGNSMPGVNEGIGASIRLAGALLALIPGVPDLGGVADAVLKPLYSNVLLAFGQWEDHQRKARLGSSHYWEKWAEGSDKAYTISWLLAMRTALWESRETTKLLVQIADGAGGWRVGQNGKGHFYIGTRIAVASDCLPPGELAVERVHELTLSWGRNESPNWQIMLGVRETEDPVIRAWEKFQEILGLFRDLGVL
ncbi:phage tail protein [Nocardia cyriacigeorgica]|uniref:Gp37-like protein n=1 Tax=Nocardia cyriacigeorgica TaxID=135487 RepID=UPI00245640B4|nr:phage tail protein [Nocardia cyriacigeorgica]